MTIKEYYALNEQEKLKFIKQVAEEYHQYNKNFNNSVNFLLFNKKSRISIPNKYHQQNGGMLTYVDKLMIPGSQRTFYLTLCDCGRWAITRSDRFAKGDKEGNSSCGCLSKNNQFHKIDYTQIKHPFYTFIKQLNTKDKELDHYSYNWEIECKKCGKKFELPPWRLLNSTSAYNPCDCWRNNYKGEIKIGELLKGNNIFYTIQKSFSDLKGDKQVLKFDFYVNNNYLIEYDGIGHYQPRQFGGMTKEQSIIAFEQQKRYDQLKNNYCKENNIPLIRIPYTHLDKLCIKDLLLETTKFRYC